MALPRRPSAFKQCVVAVVLAALLPAPSLLIPQAVRAVPRRGANVNPTPEEVAELRKKSDAFQKKSRREGQQRLEKILARHQAGWHDVELTAPFWRQGDGFSSTLIINNTFSRAVDVTPVAHLANGKEVSGRSVRLRANGSIDASMTELFGGDLRGYGQIALRYRGETQEINAQVVIADPDRSLSLDHPLERADDFSESSLEGLFYLPNASTHSEIALSNSTSSSLVVSVAVRSEDESNKKEPNKQELKIGPWATELVSLRSLLKGGNGRTPIAGRVLVSHSGRPGDLRIHGMQTDPKGYSANMRFMESGAMGGDKLFSPVLPLADATSPVVLLSNSNNKDATIHVEAYYSVDGELDETTLRTVTVPAQSAIHVELAHEIRALPSKAKNIGLILEYYAHGGILADVLLIDESGSGVYQVSPKGYASHGHASHSFPIRLSGELNTIITIANPSETDELTYSLNIFHSGKTFVYKGTKLRPGEILNVDIRALRDGKELSASKYALPANFTVGQAVLHFKPPDKPTVVTTQHAGHHEETEILGIASATTFDPKKKISFFDCAPQCPPEFYYGEVSGNAYWEGIMDDYGYSLDFTTYDAGGSLFNPSGLAAYWTNSGSPGISASGSWIELLQPGTAFAGGSVSAWGTYCFASSCNCGDWTPFFEMEVYAVIWVPEPILFRQFNSAQQQANGNLHFSYIWDSNTGRMQDLRNCEIGEYTTYPGQSDPYYWPSPPWVSTGTSQNPTVRWITAVRNPGTGMNDDHSTRAFVNTANFNFSPPATFTATQTYRYRCTHLDNNNPIDFQTQDIVRTVSPNGNGGWKYEVTKSGASHGIDPITP